MQNMKSPFCYLTDQGRTSCHGLITQISELLAFKDKLIDKWILGLEPSKMKANSGSPGKISKHFVLVSSMNKLPREVMANLFHLKCHPDSRNPKHCTWMYLEAKSKLWRKECQDQPAMSAKGGGIYSESTGQPLVTHLQNRPALRKENWTAASLLLDNDSYVLTAVKSLAIQWHKIRVFKV